MDRMLVAVFDSNDSALAVRDELVALGLPGDRVHVRAATAEDLAADGDDLTDRRGFFERLFGGPKQDADYSGRYAEAMRRGSCVVVVDAVDEDRVDRAASITARHGAVDVDERASKWAESGWTGNDDNAPAFTEDEIRAERARYAAARAASGDVATGGLSATTERGGVAPAEGTTLRSDVGDVTRIPVVEENLEVGKRAIERGGVRVFTRTTERPVEENLTLREERARVERRAVDRPATAADLDAAFREGTIEVRETQEQPVVSKTARVVEEVEVAKEVAERTEQVRDTVRRTEVEVEDLPASRKGATRTKRGSKPVGGG